MAEVSNYLREYETIYVLKPDLEDTKVIEVAERMRGVVEQGGGKSIKIHNWGKKKLAYEVDKVQKGVYIYHHYLGGPKLVAEYERVLKIMDEALIYQTSRLADAVDASARAVEPDVLTAPVREPGKRDRDHDDRPRDMDREDGDVLARDHDRDRDRGRYDDRPRPPRPVADDHATTGAPAAADKLEE